MSPETRGTLRHLLTFLGGGLVAHGYLTDVGLQELINVIEVVLGAVVTVGGFWLSIRAKRAASREAAAIAAKVAAASAAKLFNEREGDTQ